MIDKDYIIKMKKMAEESVRRFYSDENNQKMMHEAEGDEPGGYNGSTFLYIRAFEGDNGARPIPAGIAFWLSPDIELYQNGLLVDTLNPLVPNTSYSVRVTVTNGGDLDCTNCTVDLYLCEPSIGFRTTGALMIGIDNKRVIAHSTATFEFPFTTTNSMSGHRCMFARAYSLVANDYPADLVNFNTYGDRHIGQQNLNIVKQGESLDFIVNRFLKANNKDFEIILKPDLNLFNTRKEIQRRYSHPNKIISTNDFKFTRKEAVRVLPDIINKRPENIITREKKINPSGKIKGIPEIKRIKTDVWLHRFDSGINKMKITVPNLGLKENEAVPMSLTVKDSETGIIIGGITVLVVG